MGESETLTKILIVAAEASSELYGARIIEEARRRGHRWQFIGIGSAGMQSQGAEIIERSERMAVVGLAEVLKHFKVIKNAFYSLLAVASKEKPNAALLMDYPDFNLRLARRLKAMAVPVVYFISPQVWAWRQGRVHLIKKIVSKMLVVFPFEKEFYQRFGVDVEFVGHPLLDELERAKLSSAQRIQERQKLGFKPDDFVVALLPGSRHSEIKYILATQIEAARRLQAARPLVKFVLLVAPTLELEEIRSLLPSDLPESFRLVKDEPFKILQLSEAALVASGTATLVTSLAQIPMVIVYKMNPVTGWLAKYLVRGPAFFGMPNLILGGRVVPELFQAEASAEKVSEELTRYIDDSQYYIEVKEKLASVGQKLGGGGAVSRVVDELERLIK
ncbi:MAG: lipid-A-disaccharide synthase [Oligoflexia bacterium]|nr:lipid-A-disaccharide synthase [Oligoflexia bacterium]